MNNPYRLTVVLISIVFGFGTTNSAVADYSHCAAPTAIRPPANFATDQEANQWREKIDMYTVDVASYLQCLATYAQDNKDSVTTDELNSMRSSHSRTVEQARRVADDWNRAYSSYQKRNADKGN